MVKELPLTIVHVAAYSLAPLKAWHRLMQILVQMETPRCRVAFPAIWHHPAVLKGDLHCGMQLQTAPEIPLTLILTLTQKVTVIPGPDPAP